MNTILIAAIAPPGGGRNDITSRFARHFNILSIESFDDGIMRTIFLPVMQWHFQKSAFPEEYTRYINVRTIGQTHPYTHINTIMHVCSLFLDDC